MTNDEIYLYMLSSRLELEWLLRKIIHDGRDPLIVAYALTEKLALHLNYYKNLWEEGVRR
jgi:hypothetical protein